MFNPNINFDIEKIWGRMASIYRFLSPEDRKMVETMWEGLFEGLSALFYNLSQATLSPIISSSRGFLETSYETLDIYNRGPNKSVKQEFDINNINVSKIVTIQGVSYILADGRIYRKASHQSEHWIDYSTENLPFSFNNILDIDNELFAVRSDASTKNGLYRVVAGVWTLVFQQEKIKTIFKLPDGRYFVLTETAAGTIFKISLTEPLNNQILAITALGETTTGKIVDAHLLGTSRVVLLFSKRFYSAVIGTGAWT